MTGSRLERKLAAEVARASADFRLIEPDDHVMVCVSGGKDSLVLLHLLRGIARRAPFPFSFIAVHLDQRQPGYPEGVLDAYFERAGYPYRIVREDTYSIVKDRVEEGDTYCALCSRLRRGILYNIAVELGATKIALGHHRDDIIETLLLNLFYTGQLKAMPPRLRSDDGRNIVIRPLAYAAEADIAALATELDLPVLPCGLCGSQPDLKRQWVKGLIAELSRDNPHLRGNLLAALSTVRPTHLLDRDLWRRLGIGEADEAGDALVPLRRAPGDVG
jgi:tRNA 2-thiocytidine biosynthesis protein TtcA